MKKLRSAVVVLVLSSCVTAHEVALHKWAVSLATTHPKANK